MNLHGHSLYRINRIPRQIADREKKMFQITTDGSDPLGLAHLATEHANSHSRLQYLHTWQHSGFSVDQSAGDQQGIERLILYMTRCPCSLSRLVNESQELTYVDIDAFLANF